MMPYRFTSKLCLSLVTCLLMPGLSLAATTPKPLLNTQIKGSPASTAASKDSKTTTPSKKIEPKSVISEENQQLINHLTQQLPADTRAELNRLSDALHLEDRAIYSELRDDEENALSDIGMLWQAAVERSGTIRYAIEKLSRRDATGKPLAEDSFSKRMLQNLVHLSGVAGSMWTGTPASLIGANMIQDIMSGNPQESALSRVTDADMVILAKEVESLQTDLIRLYYQYEHAKERLTLAEEANSTITRYYDHATKSDKSELSQSLQPLMQTLYESTRQDTQNAQQTYNSAKTALSLVVGPDALAA